MSDNLIRIEKHHLTFMGLLGAVTTTAAINTCIAALLTAIAFGYDFMTNFIFSQCIGFTIYLSNLAVIPIYKKAKRLSSQIAIIAITIAAGATLGVILGAAANGISLASFLRTNSAWFGQAVLLGIFFGIAVSYVFISAGKINEEKMRRLETEKRAVETDIKLLQSQMEPHFLFNTLSNVLGLIESDPAKAKLMLESFTAFLRVSFLTARDRTVTLSQEMDVIGNYLEIFSVRMGDRLRRSIDIPDELRDFRIPALLIQPLVENAIKHGLEPSVKGGEIAVWARKEGGRLIINVADTGIGINEKSAGSGIGLENVRKRLELLYGERARLTIAENAPSGIITTIELPYETG